MITLLKIKILKWRIKLLVTRYHRTKNPIGSGRRKKIIDDPIIVSSGKEEGGS